MNSCILGATRIQQSLSREVHKQPCVSAQQASPGKRGVAAEQCTRVSAPPDCPLCCLQCSQPAPAAGGGSSGQRWHWVGVAAGSGGSRQGQQRAGVAVCRGGTGQGRQWAVAAMGRGGSGQGQQCSLSCSLNPGKCGGGLVQPLRIKEL